MLSSRFFLLGRGQVLHYSRLCRQPSSGRLFDSSTTALYGAKLRNRMKESNYSSLADTVPERR
jgi:hypothetical protein